MKPIPDGAIAGPRADWDELFAGIADAFGAVWSAGPTCARHAREVR